MQSRFERFAELNARRDLAINLHSTGEHTDAYMLELALADDFLNFILDETADVPAYQAYLYDAVQQVNYFLNFLQINGLSKPGLELFSSHYSSLISIANYVYIIKVNLPPIAHAYQGSVFTRNQQTEDRPLPPPGIEEEQTHAITKKSA